jgi:hypothetical protein
MDESNYQIASKSEQDSAISIIEIIPIEVKKWVESLPLSQRRYVLSLCHLMCAVPSETQVEFLNNYVADSLVSQIIEDHVPQQIIKKHLKKFHIEKELSDLELKKYIEQYYIHSAQDLRTQPIFYLESVLRLIYNIEERNNLFNYILGFEIIKMIFKMSWLQHERLYKLQKNQEGFIKTYIKPIQHTHRVNGIIVPRHEKIFFAKRNYFVKKPKIREKKLIELVIATFTTDTVTDLGFLVIRNLNFLAFDYEYIFSSESDSIFLTY